MPLYRFTCDKCGGVFTRLLKQGQQKQRQQCECGGELKRSPKPPGSTMMETLDNGAMAKKLERLQNAEELHRDRAKSDPRFKRV
jgi:putative FmdB family regulatory protein